MARHGHLRSSIARWDINGRALAMLPGGIPGSGMADGERVLGHSGICIYAGKRAAQTVTAGLADAASDPMSSDVETRSNDVLLQRKLQRLPRQAAGATRCCD
jgi:hypothetical protein